MLLLTLAAAGFGFYYFMKSPPDSSDVNKRYGYETDNSTFDDGEDSGAYLDDCQRYINADIIRECIEAKTERLNRNQ